MARNNTKAIQDVIRKTRTLEKPYRRLRARAGKLRSEELNTWRSLEKVLGRRAGRLMALQQRPVREDKMTHDSSATSGSLVAMARVRDSSGYFAAPRRFVSSVSPTTTSMLIPVFFVPLFIILHLAALFQTRRLNTEKESRSWK